MINKKIKISGMTCVACSSGIERTLKKLDKVEKAEVSFTNEILNITYDESLDFSIIEKKIKDLGFKISLDSDKKINYKLKLILSCIVTLPLLYIAMAHMIPFINLPYFSIIDPMKNPLNFAIIQAILCTIVVIIGYKFYTVGYKLLIKKNPNMDSLIAIGTTASYLYSIYSLFKIISGDMSYVHNLYFESTATIITLVILGKFLELKSKNKTNSAVKSLMDLSPKKGLIFKNNEEVLIDVSEIVIGDIVIVKSGDIIPVDGIVIFGDASIDESMITGESMPVYKTQGSNVIGATINKSGYIKVKVTKIGSDAMLSKIISLVEKASLSKAPIAKIADKISGYFTTTILIISVCTFLFWIITGSGIEFALTIFVSVLVIACPCALGLATPIAIVAAAGKGAKLGILFKDAESLEALNKIDTIVFDKTGTLTNGKPVLTDVISCLDISKEELIKITASLEKNSNHPISIAIIKEAENMNLKLYNVENFINITGKGISGNIDNKKIYVGNKSLVKSLGIENFYEEEVLKLLNIGKTIIYIVIDNKISGIIGVSDTIKENSKKLIKELEKLNITSYMMTGDNKISANYISKELNISNVISEVLPEHKGNEVEKLIKSGKNVAFVGDGINDSIALTTSNVGIAIGSGTDVAIESASIVLVSNDIFKIITAIKLSKFTMKIVKQNLFWAFGYNIIGIPIAMGALHLFGGPLLNPMIAAAAMTFSSVSVVTNALRLNGFKEK